MESDGDHCSICKKDLPHNSQTFGGVIAGGVVALSGECCAGKLKERVLTGVYVNRNNYGGFQQTNAPRNPTSLRPEQIAGAVAGLQDHFAKIDPAGAEILKRAGVPSMTPILNTADSAWKADDAAWFTANPTRAHRLRPTLPGELGTLFPGGMVPAVPERHEFQVLIRQVKPGVRVRTPFCRNVDTPIPGIEAVLHALFDTVSGSKGGVVSVREVAKLARQYAPLSNREVS